MSARPNDRLAQASNINQCLQSHVRRLNGHVHMYITIFVYILIDERTTADSRQPRELPRSESETLTIGVGPGTDDIELSVSLSSTRSEGSTVSLTGSRREPPTRKVKGYLKWVRNDKRTVYVSPSFLAKVSAPRKVQRKTSGTH